MIKITKAGEKMLDSTFGDNNIRGFQIEHIKPTCNACRHELRLVPGTPKPEDEILYASDYMFYVDKELLKRAKIITIDAAGDIPVLFTRASIDPREQV